jgi:hypothetical protein
MRVCIVGSNGRTGVSLEGGLKLVISVFDPLVLMLMMRVHVVGGAGLLPSCFGGLCFFLRSVVGSLIAFLFVVLLQKELAYCSSVCGAVYWFLVEVKFRCCY